MSLDAYLKASRRPTAIRNLAYGWWSITGGGDPAEGCAEGILGAITTEGMLGDTSYLAGHRGWPAPRVGGRYEQRGDVDLIGRRSAELDLRDREPTFDFLTSERPDTVVMAAAKVGGILANNTLPGRLPLRQPAHPDQRPGRRPRRRRRAAAVPRLVLHLPQARATADPGVVAAHRPARAHQRRLRDRQDRRRPARPGDASAVRPPLDQCHAHQPLRPRRQLRPAVVARARRADPALPRGRRLGRPQRHRLGHRQAAPRVPALRRPRGRLPVPARPLRRSRARSTSVPGRTSRSANSPTSSPRSPATPVASSSTPASRTGRPASCFDVTRLDELGWKASIEPRGRDPADVCRVRGSGNA